MKYNWTCIGVTHEYWSSDVGLGKEKISEIFIDDVGDGGCKSDKYHRDIQLLLNGLDAEPNNHRYMFYLANSYFCVGRYDRAVMWYKKRVSINEWEEERWYSMYKLAMCYKKMGKSKKFQSRMIKAYNTRPTRTEPLYYLSQYYREKGMNTIACKFAEIGLETDDCNDELFCETVPKKYGFLQEISITGFYNEKTRSKGFSAINQLLLSRHVPTHVKKEAENNLVFYVQKLPSSSFEFIVDTPCKRSVKYKQMNTSVTECGSLAIVRTVNYDQVDCVYDIHDSKGLIRTENILYNLVDKTGINLFTSKNTKRNYKPIKQKVRGLEDARIFLHGDEVWFTCTLTDANPDDYLPKIGLCKLSGKWDSSKLSFTGTGEITDIHLLNGPDAGRCEKNWLPFSKDGKISLIYNYEPYIVYDVESDFSIKPRYSSRINMDLSSLRGSACPIKFNDGYVAVVHHVVFNGSKRVYLHRLLFMNNEMVPEGLSVPFYLIEKGIEFVMGCFYRDGILNILAGIKDSSTHWFQMTNDDLSQLMGKKQS